MTSSGRLGPWFLSPLVRGMTWNDQLGRLRQKQCLSDNLWLQSPKETRG